MKKITVVKLAVIFICFGFYSLKAQNFRGYSDGSKVGFGFSYNVQVSVTPAGKTAWSETTNLFKVKVVSISSDSKGYFGNYEKASKYYSCSELGSVCNPDNYYSISVSLNYDCDNNGGQDIEFTRVNEEKTITLFPRKNTACNFQLANVTVVTANRENYRKRIKELETPQQNMAGNNSGSPGNQSYTGIRQTNTKSGSTELLINGSGNPQQSASGNAATHKPWEIDPNTLTQTTPAPAASNFSSTVDLVTAASSIIDMLIPSKKLKTVEEMMAEDDRAMAAEEARQKAEAAKERAEEARRERELAMAERRAFITTINDGKMPTLSQNIEDNVVYLFGLYADNLNSDYPSVSLTNAFPVAKYGDDTWPFLKTVKEDLLKAKGNSFTLMGYYKSLKEAEDSQLALSAKLRSYSFSIKNVSYAGKPATAANGTNFWGDQPKTTTINTNNSNTNTNKETDFWGEQPKATTTATDNNKNNTDTDFWNTGSKTPTKTPVSASPQSQQKGKTNTKGKPSKTGSWGIQQ